MTLESVLGAAAVPTIICLAVGILMLVIEMFTPGLGVSGGIGVAALIAAVVLQIGWGSPSTALYIIAIVLLIIILALIWFIRSFQKGRLSHSFLVLDENISGSSSSRGESVRQSLVGQEGVTQTELRPAGIALFGDDRRDVVTRGTFIEKNRPVRIVAVEGLRIVVEAVETFEPQQAQ